LLEVFMIPISSAISGQLVWSKAPYNRGYALKCNGEMVGLLQRTSFWSSEFQAESCYGSWRFRRSGCFRAGAEIVDSKSQTPIAALRPNWSGGGTLAFSDGERFRITSAGFCQAVWMVLSDNGPILSINSREKTVQLSNELRPPETRLTLLV